MQTEKWNAVIGRISIGRSEDLDDLTVPFDSRVKCPGRTLFPDVEAPKSIIRSMVSEDLAAIGVRTPEGGTGLASTALKLAALGLEHEVEVIVLTEVEYSGLECFGFRSERICGETDDQRSECEAQIRAFWGIDLII